MFLKDFFGKVNFEKKVSRRQKHAKLPRMSRVHEKLPVSTCSIFFLGMLREVPKLDQRNAVAQW